MIRGEDLIVKYRGNAVMDHVNIEFKAGLIHSILGPNGCGKSTLLKVLSRRLQGESGVFYIDVKYVKTHSLISNLMQRNSSMI